MVHAGVCYESTKRQAKSHQHLDPRRQACRHPWRQANDQACGQAREQGEGQRPEAIGRPGRTRPGEPPRPFCRSRSRFGSLGPRRFSASGLPVGSLPRGSDAAGVAARSSSPTCPPAKGWRDSSSPCGPAASVRCSLRADGGTRPVQRVLHWFCTFAAKPMTPAEDLPTAKSG